MNKIHDSVIVSWDFSHGEDGKDEGVLIVGTKQMNKKVTIINAFQGKEAEKIRDMLIDQKRDKS